MQPLSVGPLAHASYVGLCIHLYCPKADGEDKHIGTGTGFIHRRNGQDYLITNWHVLTGRKPEQPSMMISNRYPESPSRIRLAVASKSNKLFFPEAESFDLYSDGTPKWLEIKVYGRSIDLVAIPISFPSDAHVVRIEEFDNSNDAPLEVMQDVVVIGYPFGQLETNPFPIWKRASIASEPRLAVGALPKYFIDTPGRPGMSGSPIFRISSGLGAPKEVHDQVKAALNNQSALDAIMRMPDLRGYKEQISLQFVGIYSGSVGDEQLAAMNVGVAWHRGCLNMLMENPIRGNNPFPPTSAAV